MTVREYVLDALKTFRKAGDGHWALKSELPSEESLAEIAGEAVGEAMGTLTALTDEDMDDVFAALSDGE